jgi:hypothetical protein
MISLTRVVQRAWDRATSGIGSAKILRRPARLRHRKTPGFQPEVYSTALPRHVSQTPEIATVAALRMPTAGRATRELLDVNIQQKPAEHTLDAIEH